MRRSFLAATVVLVITTHAQANPELYRKTMPAMVWVVSPMKDGRITCTAGVVVNLNGEPRILGCYHGVGERPDVRLIFPVMRKAKFIHDPDYYRENLDHLAVAGKVTHKDPQRDLAVIRPSGLPEGVEALELAAEAPKAGESVHLVGNSCSYDGMLWRYREGKVKQVRNYKRSYREEPVQDVDAQVLELAISSSQGDSGGPVLNQAGELVGINHSTDRENLVAISVELSEIKATVAAARKASPSGSGGQSATAPAARGQRASK